MNVSHNSKQRKALLTPEDWLTAGLDLLMEEGHASLTIDRLCKKIGITRGSFYHHYNSRNDLAQKMLEHWLEKWTLNIKKQAEIIELDPVNTLRALIRIIRNQSAAHYDAAVRAWAMSDDLAANYLAVADQTRLEFIKSQFAALGFKGLDLENRARLLLYYEAFHPMMAAKSNEEEAEKLIEIRVKFLTNK